MALLARPHTPHTMVGSVGDGGFSDRSYTLDGWRLFPWWSSLYPSHRQWHVSFSGKDAHVFEMRGR
jgi:hypothetical protein